MSSQSWELLVKIERSEANDRLSCGECFAIMELLAEGAELGINQKRLERLTRRHLSRCRIAASSSGNVSGSWQSYQMTSLIKKRPDHKVIGQVEFAQRLSGFWIAFR